jgi:ABC-2 type transport system ATP-binding protein
VRFQEAIDGSRLANVPGVTVLSQDDGKGIVLQVAGEMDSLIKALASFPISDFETHRPSLEEIFLAYYEAGHKGGS